MKKLKMDEDIPMITKVSETIDALIMENIDNYPTAFVMGKHLKISSSTIERAFDRLVRRNLLEYTTKRVKYNNVRNTVETSYYTRIGKK